jgi:malic enzyme
MNLLAGGTLSSFGIEASGFPDDFQSPALLELKSKAPSFAVAKRKMIDLDVAILGGGFAGVYCARALGRQNR